MQEHINFLQFFCNIKMNPKWKYNQVNKLMEEDTHEIFCGKKITKNFKIRIREYYGKTKI